MIGFFKKMDGQYSQTKNDEEHTTKNLDKAELYEMIAQTFCLPPLHSRGITREYLLDVHRDKVFKVDTKMLKSFEVNLTPKQTKKVGVINSALLVKKLNLLLASRNQKPLGFNEHDPPDQVAYLNAELAGESGSVHRPDQHRGVLRRACQG